MGEIYLAKARGAGGFEKNVIIKTILPHLAAEEEFVEKFLDEGRIVVQLSHGNIVPVFDMGVEDSEYFIAMEYIAGRDLREVIKRMEVKRTKMPVDLALYIASESLKGLHYAHAKTDSGGESLGIIHRDISPSNILLSAEGDVKIIDFGIARAATRLSKTVSGRLQGKFCYMSPEQASGKALDGRSDVFSLGITLYELMTGFRPFEGQSDLESLDLVRKCEFDPPSTLNPEIPEEVDEIVARALSQKLEDRYESAEKMQVDLLQYMYSTGTAPTGTDVAKFLGELFPEGLERKELRSARGSGSQVKKLSLEDAMDAELERLLHGGTTNVDPHSTTAINSESSPKTATQYQSATTPEDSIPSVVSSITNPSAMMDAPKRSYAGAVILGVVVAAVLAWVFSQPNVVPVTIESEPSGAEIWLDGARLAGANTPHTFELEEGGHQIRLVLDGYEPLALNVPIKSSDEKKSITPADGAVLRKSAGPRSFSITTQPEGAEIFVNGVGTGTTTAKIEVSPGDVANLRATKDSCVSATYTLAYAHKRDEVLLQLDCTANGAIAQNTNNHIEEPKEDPKPHNGPVTVAFKSDPPGATVTVNGSSLGVAPQQKTYDSNDWVELELSMDGYETFKVRRRAKQMRGKVWQLKPAPMGCLDLSLINPQIAQVSVDGGPAFEVARKKLGIKLRSGEHTITAKNEAAKKEETQTVSIQASSSCSTLVLFGS